MSKPNQNQTKLNHHNQPPANPTTVCKPIQLLYVKQTPTNFPNHTCRASLAKSWISKSRCKKLPWTQKLMGNTPKDVLGLPIESTKLVKFTCICTLHESNIASERFGFGRWFSFWEGLLAGSSGEYTCRFTRQDNLHGGHAFNSLTRVSFRNDIPDTNLSVDWRLEIASSNMNI